jgi:hypothetical protein
MHWINIDSDNGGSVEFQLPLDDHFPKNDLIYDNGSSKNNDRGELIKENSGYQAVLFEKNIFNNECENYVNESNVNESHFNDKQTNLLNYGFYDDKYFKEGIMNSNETKNKYVDDSHDINVNTLSFKPVEKPSILISPDNIISLVVRKCPYCRHVGGHYHDVYDKKIRNKNGIKEKYKVTLYECSNCESKYGPYTYKKINKLLKDKIDLDERIRESYARTGLSYDKIASQVEIFYDISISHTYVKNIVEAPTEGFQETQEIVILPDDFKINDKTSKERKVTDTSIVYMFKREDVDYSGDVTADEVFIRTMGKKQYLLSIMDNNISDMPIALAVISTRKFEVIKAVFDFVFENNQLKSLTSDMFKGYGKIADENKTPHQECIFHSMDYVGNIIYNELKKKDKYDANEKIWIKMIYTEYKEILRQLNYGDALAKAKDFLVKLDNLPDFFQKIGKHLRKHFSKLCTHLQHDNISRTSNKCETFNSLPQIRRTKNISKNPKGLLRRLACTLKYYIPNKRTLQNRGDWHIFLQ